MSSIPSGSKPLTQILPSNVYYLTGVNTVASAFSTNDFTSKVALPKVNYDILPVDPDITKTIESSLPETVSNVASLFSKFPGIQNNDSDIVVGDVETDIDVSFITEGAGYLNAFGYYFYYLDSNNLPVRLTNSDDNSDSSQGYYRPTIVFPNASLNRSGGALTQGGTRRLKGNLSNGKFKNVRVGFFLISNGWKTTGNGSLTTGTGYVMHTTHRFNANYNSLVDQSLLTASDYKRGIQSALLYYVDESAWILSFEDILRPSGDSDFNDLILLIRKTPSPTVEEIARYSSVTSPENENKKALVDADGLFLWLNLSDLCSDGKNLYLDRTTYFKTNNINFIRNEVEVSMSPKDYVLGLVQKLNWNYTHQIVNQTSNSITQRFLFRPADITSNTVNGKVKLYILSRRFNTNDTIKVTDYETNYGILLDYQSVFVDLWNTSDSNRKYIDYESLSFRCGNDYNTSTDNTSLNTPNTNFSKITNVLLAWGDPYIQKVDGSYSKLEDVEGHYVLLNNKRILIEADTEKSPDTEQSDKFKGTTFYRYFTINIKGKGKFTIDLRTMHFNTEGDVKCSLALDNEIIKNMKSKVLMNAINNDPKKSYVTVFIENLKVLFIKLPTFIDIQNVVIFDMDSVKTYALNGSTGRMIR